MSGQFSLDALDELRRILLTPEYLAKTLSPMLSEWLQEHKTQVASEVVDQLAPSLRTIIERALREELREPSPEIVATLVRAIESSPTERPDAASWISRRISRHPLSSK